MGSKEWDACIYDKIEPPINPNGVCKVKKIRLVQVDIAVRDSWRDLLNDLRDECVHPWPSLHRLVLRPDRELDFSVNGQTPCLGDETHRYGR